MDFGAFVRQVGNHGAGFLSERTLTGGAGSTICRNMHCRPPIVPPVAVCQHRGHVSDGSLGPIGRGGPPDPALTPAAIFRFWLPLAATWLMMAAEGPFVAALVARLPDPKYNLAAFGVALALAFVAESPILMMLAASTALARDRESLGQVRRFSLLMNGAVTAAIALIAFPPVFGFLATRVLALPPPVAELAQRAVAMFLPWPAAIGFRRFQQGILIGAGRTCLVAYGTAVRLATMAGTGLLLFLPAARATRSER